MGEQIRVVDMARNLIRLSGFVPDEEIPIVFTGVRPGEKLSEELVASDETIELSRLEGVRRVRSARELPPANLGRDIADLEHFAEKGATGAVMQQLGAMVAMFRPVPPATPEVTIGRLVPPVEVTKPATVIGGARGAA